MAIGRTFKESLRRHSEASKLVRPDSRTYAVFSLSEIQAKLKTPNADRLWYIAEAMRQGMSVDEINELTWIDPWFLNNIRQIIEMEEAIKRSGVGSPESEILRHAKEYGFSDKRIAELTGKSETEIRNIRKHLD